MQLPPFPPLLLNVGSCIASYCACADDEASSAGIFRADRMDGSAMIMRATKQATTGANCRLAGSKGPRCGRMKVLADLLWCVQIATLLVLVISKFCALRAPITRQRGKYIYFYFDYSHKLCIQGQPVHFVHILFL
jgi:hypothetical protein